jgi:hypothetical protein
MTTTTKSTFVYQRKNSPNVYNDYRVDQTVFKHLWNMKWVDYNRFLKYKPAWPNDAIFTGAVQAIFAFLQFCFLLLTLFETILNARWTGLTAFASQICNFILEIISSICVYILYDRWQFLLYDKETGRCLRAIKGSRISDAMFSKLESCVVIWHYVTFGFHVQSGSLWFDYDLLWMVLRLIGILSNRTSNILFILQIARFILHWNCHKNNLNEWFAKCPIRIVKYLESRRDAHLMYHSLRANRQDDANDDGEEELSGGLFTSFTSRELYQQKNSSIDILQGLLERCKR